MTRQEALTQAIHYVRQAAPENQDEIIAGLTLCQQELPFTRWSEAAIMDACKQFILDNDTDTITTTDFDKSPKLPPHTVIQRRFNMTATEFRDTYFPQRPPTYGEHSDQEWLDYFIESYQKIKPTSAREYNARRAMQTPTWNTIAVRNHLHGWSALLDHCKLPRFTKEKPEPPPKPKIELTVTRSASIGSETYKVLIDK